MTPGEVTARHTSAELSEWMAYARVNPFGEWRADARAAMIARTIVMMMRDPKGPMPKLSDFMLSFEPEREATQEEVIAYFRETFGVAGEQDETL